MAQASGIISGGSDMSSNDTDRRWPGPVSANATEPSGPPEVTTEPRAAALDVENADAVAVGPRKPPRGNEHTMKNEPAVVLNMTVPMNSPGAPPAPVPSPEPPPAIARPVPRHQAQAVTVASASRVRERNRTFAIVMGILALGVILALVIVVVGLLRSQTPEPLLVPTAETAATVAPLPATATATTAVTAPRPTMTAAATTAMPAVTTAPLPTTTTPPPATSHKKNDLGTGP